MVINRKRQKANSYKIAVRRALKLQTTIKCFYGFVVIILITKLFKKIYLIKQTLKQYSYYLNPIETLKVYYCGNIYATTFLFNVRIIISWLRIDHDHVLFSF